MHFEPSQDRLKLFEYAWRVLREMSDRQRARHARDDVFSLGVREVVSVKGGFAR